MTKFIINRGFYGGRDSHDELIDRNEEGYAFWEGLRGRLWQQMADAGYDRSRDALLPVTSPDDARFDAQDYAGVTQDRRFGMPPELAGRHADFQAGLRSIVTNVGPLYPQGADAPLLTGQEVADKARPFPTQFDAHNSSQLMWQSGTGYTSRTGWIGRLLEARAAAMGVPDDARRFEAITMIANAHELSGPTRRGYYCGASAKAPVYDSRWNRQYGTQSPLVPTASKAPLRTIIEGRGAGNAAFAARSAVGDYAARMARDAADLNGDWNAAMATPVRVPGEGQDYEPDSITGQGLAFEVARSACRIIARAFLRPDLFGHPPVMAISMQSGGWDDHGQQAGQFNRRQEAFDAMSRSAELRKQAADAEVGLIYELQRIGCWDDVIGIEWSDFARTMVPNTDGTDHGWGQTLMPFGGALEGGRIFGTPPHPDLADPQVVAGDGLKGRRGIWVPTIACEQYLAAAGLFVGLTREQMVNGTSGAPAVFPHLDGFPDYPGTTSPILPLLAGAA